MTNTDENDEDIEINNIEINDNQKKKKNKKGKHVSEQKKIEESIKNDINTKSTEKEEPHLQLVDNVLQIYQTTPIDNISHNLAKFNQQLISINESDTKSNVIGAISPDYYDKIIENAEIMITDDYLQMIEHKSAKAKEKYSPFVTSQFAIDVICTSMNISIKREMKFVCIPKLNDVLVVCICSVYDANRNALIEGEIATEYLFKQRVIDEDDGEMDTSFGREKAIEVCATRAIRRIMRYVIPDFVWKRIEEIILNRIKERNEKKIENLNKNSESKKSLSMGNSDKPKVRR